MRELKQAEAAEKNPELAEAGVRLLCFPIPFNVAGPNVEQRL